MHIAAWIYNKVSGCKCKEHKGAYTSLKVGSPAFVQPEVLP